MLGAQGAVEFVAQQTGDAQDRAQWRAELMAHVRQEAALEVRGLAQLIGLGVQLGVQRQHALVGFIQLGAQGVGFTL
ncbi:hypothetical protein D3C84_1064430 [compost metagenome]